MMKRLLIIAALLVAGCKSDPTLEAAPSPAPDARPMPNMAGKKRMMGGVSAGRRDTPGKGPE